MIKYKLLEEICATELGRGRRGGDRSSPNLTRHTTLAESLNQRKRKCKTVRICVTHAPWSAKSFRLIWKNASNVLKHVECVLKNVVI